ncbi:MAG: ABC transporter permease subunit [Candidatus Obscuribacterales bacterium]|nr:ABC transporter permease subunit [Candidatus Obscuribacterales bacterium]
MKNFFRHFGLVARKELQHSFRDRDVFMYTVLIPCLVYPFLSFVGVEFTLLTQAASKDKPFKVACYGLSQGNLGYIKNAIKCGKDKTELLESNEKSAREMLHKREVDLVVSEEPKNGSLDLYVGHSFDAFMQTERFKDILDVYHRRQIKDNLNQAGSLNAYRSKLVNSHPLKQESYSLHFVMLLVSIMMMSVGVCYPSIVVTTEEFERKTIESTQLLPVSRSALILAKLASVALFGVFTGAVNFFSIIAVFALLVYTAGKLQTISASELNCLLTPLQIAEVAVCYLVMGLLLSSLMMLVTSFCRTVRSAQNWVSIPMLVVMLVPSLAFLPSISMSGAHAQPYLALIPFLGLSLTLRQFFTSGEVSAIQMLAIIASLGYTVIMASLAGLLMFRSKA